MKAADTVIFSSVMLFISLFGIWKSRKSQEKATKNDALVGSNVSVLSVALSVCSSFLSAVSLLGFPAEVYYRGAIMFWFFVMYFISFPIVAYVFLPTFYELKLPSLYEYLERRFSFYVRVVASSIFLVQTLFYMAVALYAPALALSTSLGISIFPAIVVTASLSAIYLSMGGARAGIYTSALQMAIILISLFIIVLLSFIKWDMFEIFETSYNGLRLHMTDFRPDPRVRHSFFTLVFGGCGTIFSLFAANQLTVQRYMALPTLEKAQKVVLLNIPMNIFMLFMYTIIGLVIYGVFAGCHPELAAKDQIFPYFIETKLSWAIGLEGIFIAAIYSAGLSTLTASYNALTAVALEDVVKISLKKMGKSDLLTDELNLKLIRYLPFGFAIFAVGLAIMIKYLDTMILQISFSIFGSAGGIVLGAFCIGLFCPWITSSFAALIGEIASILSCVMLVFGSIVYEVRAVNLSLEASCSNSTPVYDFWKEDYNRVTATSDNLFANYSQISYQYYAILGVLISFVAAHLSQFGRDLIFGKEKDVKINPRLLAKFMRFYVERRYPHHDHSLREDIVTPSEVPLMEKPIIKVTK